MKKTYTLLALLYTVVNFSAVIPPGKYLLHFIEGSHFLSQPINSEVCYTLTLTDSNYKLTLKSPEKFVTTLACDKYIYLEDNIRFYLSNYFLDFNIFIEEQKIIIKNENTKFYLYLKPHTKSLQIPNSKEKKEISFMPSVKTYFLTSTIENLDNQSQLFEFTPLKESENINTQNHSPKRSQNKKPGPSRDFYKYATNKINKFFDLTYTNSSPSQNDEFIQSDRNYNLKKCFDDYSYSEEHDFFQRYLEALFSANQNAQDSYENNDYDNKLNLDHLKVTPENRFSYERPLYQHFWKIQMAISSLLNDSIPEEKAVDQIHSSLKNLNSLSPSLVFPESNWTQKELKFFTRQWINYTNKNMPISCKWDLLRMLDKDACVAENQAWNGIVKFTVKNIKYSMISFNNYALIKLEPNNNTATVLWLYKDAFIDIETINIHDNFFRFMPEKKVSNKLHGFFSALCWSNKGTVFRPLWFEYPFIISDF